MNNSVFLKIACIVSTESYVIIDVRVIGYFTYKIISDCDKYCIFIPIKINKAGRSLLPS